MSQLLEGLVGSAEEVTHNVNEESDDVNSPREQKVNADGDDSNEFFFESDHVALKNNADYRNLLKTLAILEAQQYRALKDIDTIVGLKKKAMEDPVKFLEGTLDGSINVPGPQKIPSLPRIDWSRYNIPLSEINKSVPSSVSQEVSENDTTKSSKLLVRGRVFDESKPETFNQLWTVEEQQRLEELLIKYPPEEVETNRWRKIAAELGNRTAKQVCSRVQKYFLKLQRAGLPVPGRAPKAHAQADVGKKSSHPYQRKLLRPTTFFPHQEVPVSLKEPDETEIPVSSSPSSFHASSLGIKRSLINEENYEDSVAQGKLTTIMNSRKLDIMRKVLALKETRNLNNYSNVGYRCDYCNDEPIMGVRWTCEVCTDIDFCTDCVVAQLSSNTPHPLSHNLVPVKENEKAAYDRDYHPTSFSEPGCSYNYLDPNFLPGGDS